MDQLKNTLGGLTGGNKGSSHGDTAGHGHTTQQTQQSGGGGFLGGLSDKFNSAAGGGRESEKNEDYLDKAVDKAQEYMGAGDQSNESAVEQAKDEQISDFIRSQYKSTTGKEFFVKDKETRLG